MLRRLETLLGSRRMPMGVALVAFVLGLPALRLGLASDDLWHRAMLLHDYRWIPARDAPPWDLFTFSNGDTATRAAIIERGIMPWWISEGVRISFFRPVSSLTHALDYVLWPSWPVLMHVHSILWYVASVVLATALYRRIIGRTGAAAWIIGLAALLFAVDGTHGLPVGWIANRNASIAATFALGSLLAWDARRPLVAAALLALGLASGESGMAILAYFAAHAFFLDERSWRERLRGLAPAAVVAFVWMAIHRAGGYGVRGSGLYIDPMHEPLAFLVNLQSIPILAGSELGGPLPDFYFFVSTPLKIFLLAFALLVMAVAIVAGVPLLRRSKEARFFFVAGVLAVIPPCTTVPSARNLMIASFGLIGFLALLTTETTKIAKRFTAWAVTFRLAISPLVFLLQMHAMTFMVMRMDQFGEGLPKTADVAQKRLVLTNSPDSAMFYYLIVNRIEDGDPTPQKALTLAGGYRDVTITRTDERTLVVRVKEGFYRRGSDLLFRSPTEITPVGKRIEIGNECVVTTTHALPDGVIDEARYELSEPLESSHWLFMEWHGKALEPATLPAIGETRTLAGSPML